MLHDKLTKRLTNTRSVLAGHLVEAIIGQIEEVQLGHGTSCTLRHGWCIDSHKRRDFLCAVQMDDESQSEALCLLSAQPECGVMSPHLAALIPSRASFRGHLNQAPAE